MSLYQKKIYVAGHRGMVGSAIVRQLKSAGCTSIITRSHQELDLTSQVAVAQFFNSEKIEVVILAAARVGGIQANNIYPAEFIYSNLMIQSNVIHQAYLSGVDELLFLGSSCIYPKLAPQPISETHLLTDLLEPTNEPYAVAKIAGIKMCDSYNRQYGTCYRAVMPTNLFGPGDNYDLLSSHVIPAMIRKIHLAKLAMQGDSEAIHDDQQKYGALPEQIKRAIGYRSEDRSLVKGHQPEVVLWGTGSPRREFLHVDDMASACLFVMGLSQQQFSGDNPCFVNVGTGVDITIRETAELIGELIGFEGAIVYDSNKPDGTPRKLLDTTRINTMGWQPRFGFRQGLENAYSWYLAGCSGD
jgi:GDP-L-fucose synthase